MRTLIRMTIACAMLPALTGCMAMAVTGAVVGGAASVASATVGAGVAVGKGAVSVATAPFRGDDDDK